MALTSLLEAVKKLDAVTQRKISVIVGAAVGDAAARPLHWVYDNNALQTYIKDTWETPEFFPKSMSPFYTLPTGETSCYWDITESSLDAINNFNGSQYDYKMICDALIKNFGPGNPNYDMDARQVFMEKRSRGRMDEPLVGKWFHGSIIQFLDTYKNGLGSKPYGGSKIKETDGFCANIPFVCKYHGTEAFEDITLEVIKTFSTWPTAVKHGVVASKIVGHLIKSGSEYNILDIKSEIATDYPEVYRSISDIEEVIKHGMDHTRAVNYVFGSPCYNPGSFQGALHAVLTSKSYTEGIRKCIRAGGCNCSRSVFAGAMSGAMYGIDSIPIEWMEKTIGMERILSKTLQLFS
jgi:hypothetical protein